MPEKHQAGAGADSRVSVLISTYTNLLEDAERQRKQLEAERQELRKEAEASQGRLAKLERLTQLLVEAQSRLDRLSSQLRAKEAECADLDLKIKKMKDEIARINEPRDVNKPFWSRFIRAALLIPLLSIFSTAALGGTDMVLLVDRSGSMKRTDDKGLASPTAAYILDELKFRDPEARAAVVFFSSGLTVRPEDGKLTGNVDGLISLLKATPVPEGETELAGGLKASLKILEQETRDGRERQVVILTDGVPTSSTPQNYEGKAREAIEKFLQDRSKDARQADATVSKILQPYILNELIPIFRQRSIRIVPIGFAQADDLFLQQLGGTGGFRKVAEAKQLIPEIDRLIPKGPSIVSYTAPFQGETIRFDVPSGVEDLRVVVVYEEPGQVSENTRAVMSGGGRQFAPDGPESLDMKSGMGARTFERFLVKAPAGGTWELRLKRSSSNLPLPKALLLAEMKIGASLNVAIDPSQACVGQKVLVGADLQGPSAPSSSLQVSRMTAVVLDENGKSIDNFTLTPDKDRAFHHTIDVGGAYAPGSKAIHVTAELGPHSTVKSSVPFNVLPAEACNCPVDIKVDSFPYGGKHGSLKRDVIAFPPIGAGQQREFTIGPFKLRVPVGAISPQCGNRFPVELRVTPLVSEKGDSLGGSVRWIQTSPSKGHIGEQLPFEFEVTASLPQEITSDLEDGIYTGAVQVISKNLQNQLNLPLEVTIKVPVIQVLNPMSFQKPRETVQASLCCPPPTQRPFSLVFRSTSPVPVNIEAVSTGAFFYRNEREKRDDPIAQDDLRLTPTFDVGSPVLVPADHKQRLSYIIEAQSADRLLPGLYHTELLLKGDAVRARTLDLHLVIPGSYKWIWVIRVSGVLVVLLLLVFVGTRVGRLVRGIDSTRRRFRGEAVFSSGDGSAVFSSESLSINHDPTSRQWVLYANRNLDYLSAVEGHTILAAGSSTSLSNGDQIRLSPDATLNVFVSPSESTVDHLVVSIGTSPFSRILPFFLALLTAVAAGVGAISLWYPGLVCNLVARFWPFS